MNSEANVKVTDHGEFVSSEFPNGDTQTLSWKDLIRIEIQTNDSGPDGWDTWWYLHGDKEHVCYPIGSTGEDEILEKLLSITNHREEELVQGMNCTENRTFVCWRKGSAD